MGGKNSKQRARSNSAADAGAGAPAPGAAPSRAESGAAAAPTRQRGATVSSASGAFVARDVIARSPQLQCTAQTPWPADVLAHLVLTAALVEFSPGSDDEPQGADAQPAEECPTCLKYYTTGMNECTACRNGVCSNCFAQFMPPPANTTVFARAFAKPSKGPQTAPLQLRDGARCPFCDAAPVTFAVRARVSVEAFEAERAARQAVADQERALLDAAIREERERIERLQGKPPAAPQPPQQQPHQQPTPSAAPAAAATPRLATRSSLSASAAFAQRQHTAQPYDVAATGGALDDALPPELLATVRHEEFRQRLITFYRFRAPGKLQDVPKLLNRYYDQRDTLVAALVDKYGPEPRGPPLAEDVHARVVAFYAAKGIVKPHAEVDAMLDRFAGEEWRLMAAVVLEHGDERNVLAVPPPGLLQASSQAGAATAPSRGPSTEGNAAAGSPQAAASAGAKPNNTPPMVRREALRRRVRTYLRFRAPHRLPELPQLLREYRGVERELLEGLVAVHGAEPKGDELVRDVAARVRHLYATRVTPPRTDADVAALMTRFAGEEHNLLAAMVIKYGDEDDDMPPPPGGPVNRAVPAAASTGRQAVQAQKPSEEEDDENLRLALTLSLSEFAAPSPARPSSNSASAVAGGALRLWQCSCGHANMNTATCCNPAGCGGVMPS